jgi:hypothetical protein
MPIIDVSERSISIGWVMSLALVYLFFLSYLVDLSATSLAILSTSSLATLSSTTFLSTSFYATTFDSYLTFTFSTSSILFFLEASFLFIDTFSCLLGLPLLLLKLNVWRLKGEMTSPIFPRLFSFWILPFLFLHLQFYLWVGLFYWRKLSHNYMHFDAPIIHDSCILCIPIEELSCSNSILWPLSNHVF